jgi:oxazoline/thiazoline synthase
VSLVVVDDYLQPELERVNAEQLASGRPWLLVKPRGFYVWIGPLFVPGQTACWRCLEQRLRANREVEGFVERRSGRGPVATSVAALPATEGLALQLAALQLALELGSAHPTPLRSRIVTVSGAALQQQEHVVVRRPQCPACGDPACAENSDDIALPQATGGALVADGGLRAVSPEATYERYRHLVSPITGVVTSLVPAAGLGDSPLFVYVAGHNFALKNDSLYFLRDGLRTNSAGKGMTAAQARTSALCEAIERYSGVHRGDERRIRARCVDLGEQAIHPNDCMLYSERQYAERAAWMARGSRFQVVPLPFDPGAELDWTPVRSLVDGTTRYLPTAYLYYGYPLAPDEFVTWADSNGNAAGNTLEEALLQGFLELAERDAVCIWWYNRLARPAFDLASLDEPYVERLEAYYRTRGRELWVLDLTNDLEIPAFAAINRRVDDPVEDIVLGFGAHLDARVAVLRALAEMNQFMPAVHERGPDGRTAYAFDDPDVLRWWQTATLANQPYLAPSGQAPRTLGDFARSSSSDVGRDLLACVERAAAVGCETFALNQTRPDIGLPVAKVIVPGLRHFWARFAPGRLYDVPVRLGWRDAPLDESLLNPIPMFV